MVYGKDDVEHMILLDGCWAESDVCVGDSRMTWASSRIEIKSWPVRQELVGLSVKLPSTENQGSLAPYLVRRVRSWGDEYAWISELGGRLKEEGCVQFLFSPHSFCIGSEYLVSRFGSFDSFKRGVVKYFDATSLVFESEDGNLYPIDDTSEVRLTNYHFFRAEGCVPGMPGHCFPEIKGQKFFFQHYDHLEPEWFEILGVTIERPDIDEYYLGKIVIRDKNDHLVTLLLTNYKSFFIGFGCMEQFKICVNQTVTLEPQTPSERPKELKVIGFNNIEQTVVGLSGISYYRVKPYQLGFGPR